MEEKLALYERLFDSMDGLDTKTMLLFVLAAMSVEELTKVVEFSENMAKREKS